MTRSFGRAVRSQFQTDRKAVLVSRYGSAARFFLLLVALVATACSSATFEVAFQDVSADVEVPLDTQDLNRDSASDALDALTSEPGTNAGRDAAEAETSMAADSSPEADAEPIPEAAPDASADTTGEATADTSTSTDASTDVTKDAVPDALVDACPGGGAAGEVVIGVCKPSSGDPGYLGVALRVLYPPGTIVPNEEWKNPWPGCSSSTTADCICCHVRPSSGAAMPLKSDIDFHAGTSTKSGLPVSSWYTAESYVIGSYYGYWGPMQVGYAPHGTFPPLYKGKPNALSRPKSGFDPDHILFHYE